MVKEKNEGHIKLRRLQGSSRRNTGAKKVSKPEIKKPNVKKQEEE